MPAPDPLPVLYSFRRCPYAMRARLALLASDQRCELREVLLRDKPAKLLAASPKATVPVLVFDDGSVIAQSLDIMLWALRRSDPQHWLVPANGTLDEMLALIEACDTGFKRDLDRYKYPGRHEAETDAAAARDSGGHFLLQLEARFANGAFLFGDRTALADAAIAPFVRQFAGVDAVWFAAQPWPHLRSWLAAWEASAAFATVMQRHPAWKSGDVSVTFPAG
ncbi:glutathione S-transferase [Variovorax sp. RHLX14]|uniref:glutathione S-transferase n=1 Tax=Variovorax sp. RHLX14 TaxID=1259731 RepID=UPI003F47AD53